MTRLSFLYIIIFISMLTHSCRENIDEIDITPPNIPHISKVISSIHGTVRDVSGKEIIGAVVYLDDESTHTNENGVFQFVDKSMNENGAFISVEKEGYFAGSRRIYPTSSNTSLINIELITLESVGSFNSTDAATISKDGVVLEFSKNSIENSDGSTYVGNVDVALVFLDPTNPTTLDQMPGDLTGITMDETFVVLKSYGMIGVELMDDVGNKLQVKKGNPVQVQIPIPTDLQATAPASIPMWNFDEDEGIWVEEEIAYLSGDHYAASLPHFSFWNCDIPQDFVFINGKVFNQGSYAQGVTVMILDDNAATSAYSLTDAKGEFRGYVPNNANLTLTIFDYCGVEIYSQSLVTSTEDISLSTINLSIVSNYANISGTVSACNGQLSAYTYIVIEDGFNSYTLPIATDGSFNGTIYFCTPGQPIGITAIDPIQGITSPGYLYEIEADINVGNIELCDQALVEHIILEYGDVKWNIPFDDKLVNILFPAYDIMNQGDEGFILRSIYEPEPDSIHIFKFYIPYVEGFPVQDVSVEHVKDSDLTGNGCNGTGTSQLIVQDGIEYLLTTGTISDTLFNNTLDLGNEPMYFHVVIEN